MKKVLITGASGGIGSAIARVFAINGYYTILHYNKNTEDLNSLCALFDDNNCKYEIFQADFSAFDSICSIGEKFRDIDVLVNNAGASYSGLFNEMSDSDIERIINTDLISTIMLTKYISRGMITKKRGKIINISSMWGICGASCEVVYSAAKAGLIGFTKALAKELGPSGINVNCIAPGAIKTKMLNEYSLSDLKKIASDTPLMRLGEPSDIANVAYFLASEKSDFITGQIISPNGGLVI